MKNERLEALTTLANSTLDNLPSLLLDGEGLFVHLDDDHLEVVENGALLTMIAEARRDAKHLCFQLESEPRRRGNTRAIIEKGA